MSYPTRCQHPQGCLNHPHAVHHTPPELLHHQYQPQGFHGHASTINTSDGSHTLYEHENQIAGPAGGPTEKHQHPRKAKPEDKSGHPAHRGHVAPAMSTKIEPKPPKPGCPYLQDTRHPDAPRRNGPGHPHLHPHPYHTHPDPENRPTENKNVENSHVHHGNHRIQHQVGHQRAPNPARQHHHHHTHQATPIEPQIHRGHHHQYAYVAHSTVNHGHSHHEGGVSSASEEESPRNTRQVHLREEDIRWGFGPPLPLTVHLPRISQRRRNA